jgi:DNA-binding NarL/FixJ family response regulator
LLPAEAIEVSEVTFFYLSAVASERSTGKVGAAMVESLTKREREIVSLIAEGLTNRELANRLCISEATIRTHLTSIFLKLGVTDRLKLVVYAYRHGLADPPG